MSAVLREARNGFRQPVLVAILLILALPVTAGDVEDSYHGTLGKDSGLGMLEKWCALPNFSFDQQGGISGWTSQSCNGCHIGAAWNATKPEPQCKACHELESPVHRDHDVPTIAKCLGCHVKDTAKRGDVFDAQQDVHIAAGFLCQDCHERYNDGTSDHQFFKGTAIDTTEPTSKGTLSCADNCHSEQPHGKGVKQAKRLNGHVAKVACETCHTGLRPAMALQSRQWNRFTAGKPVTVMRAEGWKPVHKWYDNTGPGASGDGHLPILGFTERRDSEGAKIYPFNPVTVQWYVKTASSAFDDVIVVPDVKAADRLENGGNGDGLVSLEEMRTLYPEATLLIEDMNFSISHSVVPADLAFGCKDCHGRNGWLLDWESLGYGGDPKRKGNQGGPGNGNGNGNGGG